jgi:coatomer subunit beta'
MFFFLAVRSAKFIARKQWIVTGSDDRFIRVYNYETTELVKEFEAHSDYIRGVLVHPTLPCVLSSSDDILIKMWNWEKGWECAQTFEGHSHYVLQVVFNPKDTSIFASASLDATVKVFMASIFQADFRAKSCSSDFLINSCRFGILILLLLLLH